MSETIKIIEQHLSDFFLCHDGKEIGDMIKRKAVCIETMLINERNKCADELEDNFNHCITVDDYKRLVNYLCEEWRK